MDEKKAATATGAKVDVPEVKTKAAKKPLTEEQKAKKAAKAKIAREKKAAEKLATIAKPKTFNKTGIQMNPKLADPDAILDSYDKLIHQLATAESKQRNAAKPYRIYFIHRKRMEVMKLNFIKSMR